MTSAIGANKELRVVHVRRGNRWTLGKLYIVRQLDVCRGCRRVLFAGETATMGAPTHGEERPWFCTSCRPYHAIPNREQFHPRRCSMCADQPSTELQGSPEADS